MNIKTCGLSQYTKELRFEVGLLQSCLTSPTELVPVRLTLSPGDGREMKRVRDGVPAVFVLGLDVQLVGGGRVESGERDLLPVEHAAVGAAARGRHLDLSPAPQHGLRPAAVGLRGGPDGDGDGYGDAHDNGNDMKLHGATAGEAV